MRFAGIFLLVIGLGSAIAQGQDVAAAQKKLLAKRAAEADAYRKLAECIKGLQITSDTYVRDFVAESDTIRAEMDEFIRGVRLGDPRYFADGSCEVPAEVTVEKVIETIKEIHTRHYKGNRVKGKDIQEIAQHVAKKVIQVVGTGAPREDLPPDLPEGVAEQLGGPPIPPEPPIPELWMRVGAQGKLMAIRAAEVDAKRKLLERIKGLRITSDTTVRDFVAESDQISAKAYGKIVGATIVNTYLHDDEPIAEVTVEIPLETVQTVIKELHTVCVECGRIKTSDITETVKTIKTKTFRATGTGVPNPKSLERYNNQARAENPQNLIPDWAMMPIKVTGECVQPQDKAGTPQGKLMAARCAEMDAKRKLAEHIEGLSLVSSTTVKDFITEHDFIRGQVDAVIVGALVDKTSFKDDGTAEVTVILPGLQIWDAVHINKPAGG
jgi:hypothetical protein